MIGFTAALLHVLEVHPWLSELLGILPLSALLEFIDTERKLHIFQLIGAVPLWSWPITPAGSRLLLRGEVTGGFGDDQSCASPCHLDAYGNSTPWIGTDGRMGDTYVVPNSETLRLCLSTTTPKPVFNHHANIRGDRERFQHLEVVYVQRQASRVSLKTPRSLLFRPWRNFGSFYLGVASAGWVLLAVCFGGALVLGCYIAATFLVILASTGFCVHLLEGNRPRTPLRNTNTGYDRVVITSEHANSTHWTVFYGDSGLINSLTNLPLKADSSPIPPRSRALLRHVLRGLIVAQWAMVLAAAALKDWNAFFVCFWIAFSIATHSYLITPTVGAKAWMRSSAGIEMKRFETRLSSRRALLNTIMALNPDTLPWSEKEEAGKLREGDQQKRENSLAWIDLILKPCRDRTCWEETSRKALTQTRDMFTAGEVANDGDKPEFWVAAGHTWRYEDGTSRLRGDYWLRFIGEGLYMAAKLRKEIDAIRPADIEA